MVNKSQKEGLEVTEALLSIKDSGTINNLVSIISISVVRVRNDAELARWLTARG